ncbi:hypothetical protein [Halorubrum sp. DTA46]|uniref:hypothetical protein n=1 Tax=Halorubrum sp. DTA46 TaxID=3402162 RepID=UPI003AB0833E
MALIPFGMSLFGISAISVTALAIKLEVNIRYTSGSEADSDESDFDPTYITGFGATTAEEYERIYSSEP